MTHSGTILPFEFETLPIKGKLLRFDNLQTQCPSFAKVDHKTAQTLAQMLFASCAMVDDLQEGCALSLQLQNPTSNALMLSHATSDGIVKAYANDAAQDQPFTDHIASGSIFAFTIVHNGTPHQSLIELSHPTAVQTLEHYMEQSIQSLTLFRVWVSQNNDEINGNALLLQASENWNDSFEDDWDRMALLLETIKTEEITSNDISSTEMLFRLFNADEVSLYESKDLSFHQENIRESTTQALFSLGKEECEKMLQEGPIVMRDEYSGQEETFDESDIENIFLDTKKSQS